jgi:hypothetical protein
MLVLNERKELLWTSGDNIQEQLICKLIISASRTWVSTKQHGIAMQQTVPFMVTAVRRSTDPVWSVAVSMPKTTHLVRALFSSPFKSFASKSNTREKLPFEALWTSNTCKQKQSTNTKYLWVVFSKSIISKVGTVG